MTETPQSNQPPGEAVGPPAPWAGFWLRAVAKLLDLALLFLLAELCFASAFLANAAGVTAWALFRAVPIAAALAVVGLFEMTRRRGQTVGKMVLGLRVVTADGSPPGWRATFWRVLVEALPWGGLFQCLGVVVVVPLVDWLWVAWSRQKRALHDLAAGTYVVRLGTASRGELFMAPALAALFVFAGGLLVGLSMRAPQDTSGAMAPTLKADDWLLCNKLTLRLRAPRDGDVVLFRIPQYLVLGRQPQESIKRVVGVPGDSLMIKGGKLWRNGRAVAEPYVRGPMDYTWPPGADRGAQVVVPPGQLVVLGDNRNAAIDSHRWQVLSEEGRPMPKPLLPQELVRGVVVFRFSPADRVGPVDGQ